MGEFPQPLRRRPGGSDQRTQAVRGPVGLYLRGAHCRHLPTRPWPVRCQGYRTELVDPKQGIYSITKTAVINMTKAFAKECGPLGIRVNALLPGLTKTKFASALFDDKDAYDYWIKQIPLRRHAEPREMAGAVLYLASDAASYTNGECIVVDGGLTI